MNYKRFAVECSKNYAAKIHRCPDMIDDFDFTLHWHREFEAIYVEKGPLNISRVGNETVTLNDGDFYLLNSEEIHSYINVTSDLRFMVVNVPISTISPYFESNTIPNFRVESAETLEHIKASLKNLMACENLEGKIETLLVKAMLNNVFFYLFRDCVDNSIEYVHGSVSDDFDCAKSAADYMYEHYQEEITLSKIAEYVGMTPAHFSKYFKDKTNVTFTRYLRKIRLDTAIADMCQNDMSVKNASANSGFPNVNAFIIACKEEYGKTPAEMKVYAKT